MAVVKFNVEDEFCQELEKDADKVDRGIVRATNLFRTSSVSPNIHHVLVVATYSVGGQVVRLERYCGDLWQINDEADRKVLDRANAAHKAIEEACERLYLEVRPGTLEEG